MERNDDDLDRRLRGAASRHVQAIEHDVDLERDLAAVRAQHGEVAAPVAVAVPGRWLLAAACAVLMVAGGVAVVVLRGGGDDSLSGVTVPPAPTVAPTSLTTPTTPAPTSAPATVALTTTPATSSVPTSEAPSDCGDVVLAPPSLADGSTTPVEVTVEAGGTRAVWGSQPMVQVVQVVDDPPGAEPFAEGAFMAGDYEAVLQSVGGRQVSVLLRGPTGFCPRRYDVALPDVDAWALVRRWLESYATGDPVPGGDHPELTLPAGYVGASWGEGDQPAYVRFSPNGVNLGPVADQEVADAAARVGWIVDGRVVRYVPGSDWPGVCENRPVELLARDVAQAVHPDVPAVVSMAVSLNGIFAATRYACAEGAAIDDPSNAVELIRVDLSVPGSPVEILRRDPLDLRDGANWAGNRRVESITFGRYLVMSESINIEQSRFQVFDVAANVSTPIDFASGCAAAADIIGAPVLKDGHMVVPRWCPGPADSAGGTGDIVVDQVRLDDGAVVWSGRLTVAELYPSYGNTVGISVHLDPLDGSPWVIVNGGDVEQPTTSVLLHGDDELDITHLGIFSIAFTLDELIPS